MSRRHPQHSIRSLTLLVAVAACSPAPAKSTDTAMGTVAAPATVDVSALKDAIQAREKEWSAAYLAANSAGVAALYAEDGASVPPTGDWMRGRAAIAKYMQAGFDTVTAASREDVTEEVIPAGDHVVEVGHYSWKGSHKRTKAALSGAGRYMVVWRKDADGQWRLLRDIGSEAPPAPKS